MSVSVFREDFSGILQVLPALESGGVECMTLDLVLALEKMHFPYKSYVASAGGKMLEKLNNSDVTHLTLPLKSKNPKQMFLNTQELQRIIQDHNIKLIHAHSRAPAWSALFAAKRKKIPFVTTYHGTYNSTNFIKKFYNSVMIRSDKVIAISKFIENHIQQHYAINPEKIALIPEGVDVESYAPDKVHLSKTQELKSIWRIAPNDFVFMLPGRLTEWKGQKTFLKAIAKMTQENIVAIILGPDQGRSQYRSELESLVDTLEIRAKVRFVNECSDMSAAYSVADVVVSASTDPEAFGRVTAEALSMRRIVVGTNHGATPELCKDHGFLVKPGDVEHLCATLNQVYNLTNDEKRERGEKGRLHIVENFSLTGMIKQTINLYETLCNVSSS